MSSIGEVLGWKFNHAPGICTVDGVITSWPETLGEQPTPEDIEAWRKELVIEQTWQLIKAERQRRTEQGGYLVGGKWYHSDSFSRGQQLGLKIEAEGIAAASGDMNAAMIAAPWKTMDGSFVTMTATLARQIFQAAIASDVAVFTVAEQHKAAMAASEDPAAYDYLSGWPSCFLDL